METDWILLLWLLLPLAAASGWLVAKQSFNRNIANTNKKLSPEYFKGLNYVLNEQPDKAIEIFIKMLEVDSDTVETHLALGNLFRRRGEVDRAIRIHQNLIARPTLNREQRSMALLELGMDYMRSGLLDRAEGLFEELVESGAYTSQAYAELLKIYQQEKDWNNAIAVARRLEAVSGENLDQMIAQFYCEHACENFSRSEDKKGKDNLKRALNIAPDCVRASLIEAEMASRAGKYRQAIKAYKRIEKQDPEYIPEIISPMLNCYRQINKIDEYMKYLREIVATYGGITPLLSLTELIEEVNGEKDAIKFISMELKRRSTVRGVDKLIEYTLTNADGEIRDSLKMIKDMTGKLLQSSSVYQCIHCGFDGKSIHWQCPSCKRWNTIKPVHGIEGE